MENFSIIFISFTSIFIFLTTIAVVLYFCYWNEEKKKKLCKGLIYAFWQIADQLSDIGFCFGSIYKYKIFFYLSLVFLVLQPSVFFVIGSFKYVFGKKSNNLNLIFIIMGYFFFIPLYVIFNWFKLFGLEIEIFDKILQRIQDDINTDEIKLTQNCIMGITETIPNLIIQGISNSQTGDWSSLNILSLFVGCVNLLIECYEVIGYMTKIEKKNENSPPGKI